MRRAIVVCAALATACTIMNGLEFHGEDGVTEPVPDDDSGTKKPPKDGQGATAADGAPVCTPKHFPDKPPKQPAGTDVTIVTALRSLESSITNDQPANGIDLDGVCTCNGGGETCKPAAGATQHCDYNNAGVDNAGRGLFQAIAAFNLNILASLEQAIQLGTDGRVFQVENYNGTANDDDVKVTIFRSPGIPSGPDFTKKDTWKVDSQPAVSTTGWVTNNVLVASFETMNVIFLEGSAKPAKLIGGRFSAQVIAGPDGPTIDSGLIVGRSPANDMIASVGELTPPELQGAALCQVDPYKGFATGKVCTASDLALDPAQDGKDATCAALSLAVSFQLAPALKGGTVTLGHPGSNCDDQAPIVCP